MRAYFMRSARIGFGTWSPDDFPLAVALWGDARVTRLIGGPLDEAHVRERLRQEIATQESRGIQYWPIFHLVDGAHLGCCGLRPWRDPTALELGFHLRPEHWGRGYASESARAVMIHAGGMDGVAALVAGHHPENHDSRRILE